MSISKTEKNTLLVEITGELDHHTATKIRTKIDNAISKDYKNIIFDFSALTFMDSSGIGMIMGRYKKILKYDGKMTIVSPKPQVKRILEISGLMNIVTLETSINKALKRM
ncbi:MAG: anti-sigma F factor antagonist [Eubacteriales bacterium]|nr:anti-sigma F factor antagonist [Eubacteriales bacterium]